MAKKLVYGVGDNDVPGFSKSWKYEFWKGGLRRGYSKKFLLNHATYIGVTFHPDWLKSSNFDNSIIHNHYVPGYCLDKDILIRGNKEYSEVACRYVPQYLNKLLLDRGAARGLMLGVSENGKGFRARCWQFQANGTYKRACLGTFDTPEQAHAAWQRGKIVAIENAIARYKTEPMPLREIIAALELRIQTLRDDIKNGCETKKL